jgi:hypothetical protein
LTYNESDYGAPLVAVPADFYGLHDAWIYGLGSAKPYPLVVVPELRPSFSVGVPTTIAYQKEIASFRVHPRSGLSSPEWWVEGVYKKTPTKITTTNINSYVLPWDDMYFEVFRQGLVWKYKQDIIGAPDALREYQLFLSMIDTMAADEGLHSGVKMIAPAESL